MFAVDISDLRLEIRTMTEFHRKDFASKGWHDFCLQVFQGLWFRPTYSRCRRVARAAFRWGRHDPGRLPLARKRRVALTHTHKSNTRMYVPLLLLLLVAQGQEDCMWGVCDQCDAIGVSIGIVPLHKIRISYLNYVFYIWFAYTFSLFFALPNLYDYLMVLPDVFPCVCRSFLCMQGRANLFTYAWMFVRFSFH